MEKVFDSGTHPLSGIKSKINFPSIYKYIKILTGNKAAAYKSVATTFRNAIAQVVCPFADR